MEKAEGVRVTLDTIAALLWRSAVIGFALLMLWLVICLLAGEWMYEVHHRLFDIEKVDFVRINYGGMALVKLAVFLLFLTPYISIRWYLVRSK
ncbi:MAG: hypothetical protein JSV79_07860 [Armatimonadota bacterium]|nr:MAG: hypothetical protein JSV79_07860 [Armatimonadota bacterium]